MHPPTRYVNTSDDVRIAYAVHGQGPPLVYVRGWVSSLDDMWDDPEFRSYMEAIGRHFTVTRFDSRGNGLSDRQPKSLRLDDLVCDLETVLERVDDDQVVLYGTCYGGLIAARYAARHPDRVSALILDGTYARGEDLVTPAMRESMTGLLGMLELQPRAAHTMLAYFTNPDTNDLSDLRLERTRRAINGDIAARLYELSFEVDVSADLRSLPMPTLVVHRRRTRAVPLVHGQHVAALVRDATFVAVDGAAHNPWEGDAAQPLAVMSQFLGVPIVDSYRPRTSSRPTVILFTDMENSTATTARVGDDRAQDIVRRHNAIVRAALQGRPGRIVKNTGDGVMAQFSSVASAVDCAIAIQRSFDEDKQAHPDAAIRVRMGINAGEPLSEDDDLHGIVVATASRICDKALAGEILVSNVVRELAIGKDLTFSDVGFHELKGLTEPLQLYRVDF